MERSNVHISLGKGYTHYHRVMSGLVCEYTPKGGSVLDVGCGLGHLLELVERSEPSLVLTGADASEECVTNTLQRVPYRGIAYKDPPSVSGLPTGVPYSESPKGISPWGDPLRDPL